MEYISTDKAPAAIGPYSQAIKAGNFIFASGQIPINPQDGEIDTTTITDQADRVCRNIGEILSAAGYEKYFVGKPARSCVAVKQLPRNVLCEVEVIAYVG